VPVDLDDTDAAILKSLMADGRKSFRAISREIRVSSPTVMARYERLVNIGLIKSIQPEIDLSKIDRKKNRYFTDDMIKKLREQGKHFHVKVDNLKVKIQCEYCGGPIQGKPNVLEFAKFQRFFCCMGCKNHYREKHAGRIDSIMKQYKEMEKESRKLP
jgi:DNA-binding Lrp family transcriptional regulator